MDEIDQILQSVQPDNSQQSIQNDPVVEPNNQQQTIDESISQYGIPKEWLSKEATYKARGKEVKENLETIFKRASMGYDYAQSMESLKKREAELTQKEQIAQELSNKWKPYDEYATQNPGWRDHWENAWNNRSNSVYNTMEQISNSEGQSHNGFNPDLQKQISEVLQFKQDFEANQRAQALEASNRQLANDIDSIKKQYSDIDFDATDPENGKSLEMQILEHANYNGISNFKTAFKDFYHDQLIKRAEMQAREKVGKEIASKNRSGIIDTLSTPVSNRSNSNGSINYKQTSWDALENAALRELGLI